MLKRLWPLMLLIGAGCQHAPVSQHRPAETTYAWASFDSDTPLANGASGLADRRAGRALTIDDPVRVASISKLVVAVGVMRLVEQGRLDLDEDVSAKLGWPLRNPSFPDTPITLRLLLSHRSSLRDDIAYTVPLGSRLQDALADPKGYDRDHPPGAFFRYSNLNFPVIASIMEKTTGERFDWLMKRLVLDPLGLDGCFNWAACSDAAIDRAVVLYGTDGMPRRDDLRGEQPPCPVFVKEDAACNLEGYVPGTNGALFSPQGGLRASVRDLAVIGQLLLNGGSHQGRSFLSSRSLAEIMKPHWRFDGGNGDTEGGFYCGYGLASQHLPVRVAGCRDDLFGGRSMTGHAGDAYGVRSGLWIDPEKGVGIAYFSANNGDEPRRGRSAYRAIEEWLAARLRH